MAAITFIAPVQAEPWKGGGMGWNGHHDGDNWRYRRHRDRDRDNNFGPALFGFAAGAVVGSALAPRPYYYQEPVVVYRSGPDYISWCSARYRSFRPDLGMYMGYDGRWHQCVYPY